MTTITLIFFLLLLNKFYSIIDGDMFNQKFLKKTLTSNKINYFNNKNINLLENSKNDKNIYLYKVELLANKKINDFVPKFNKLENKNIILNNISSEKLSINNIYGIEDGFGESYSVYGKNGNLLKSGMKSNSVFKYGFLAQSMPTCRFVILIKYILCWLKS